MNNQTKNRIAQILIISIFLLILTIQIVTATYYPTGYYTYDSKIPKPEKINPTGDFIISKFTGSSSYIYPIEVPKGVNGLTPKLNIIYSSSSTTSIPTQLGTAWYLTTNYIQRDVNGTWDNITDDGFKLYFNDNSYDLIYNSTGNRFHTEIETFMLIQNKTGTNNTKKQYWELRNKDGTNMISSSETETGNIWQANVTVNDGTENSNPVESNYLKIL